MGRIRPAPLVLALLACAAALAYAPSAHAAATWPEIDAVSGQIHDADPDRILFSPAAGGLALRNRRTQVVTPIPIGSDQVPWAAFLW